MKKVFPIQCSVTKDKAPLRQAKIGLDQAGQPMLLIGCKNCGREHICTLAQMLQSWQEMSDPADLLLLEGMLKKVLRNIQAALSDQAPAAQAEGTQSREKKLEEFLQEACRLLNSYADLVTWDGELEASRNRLYIRMDACLGSHTALSVDPIVLPGEEGGA